MPRITAETLRNTQIILRKKKVFTLSRLVPKYYTMPDIPQFNVYGLCVFYNDKYFSKYGNLKKTVVHLICASETGLSGAQLGKLIGLSPQSFLHHFRKVSVII